MKNHTIQVVIRAGIMCWLFAGCRQEPSAATAEPSSAASTTAAGRHASATAVPGSHEDWCGEHQVPESQCTLCNPSLVAAFKATGDWCEEHALPESQCRLCNPNLRLERPPKAETK